MAQTADASGDRSGDMLVVDCDVHVAHEAAVVKREVESRLAGPGPPAGA